MKSAPHLEPQRWQRILEHIADTKRKENTSAPQSAILTQTAQGFQPRGFQNHIPARGRKLSFDNHVYKNNEEYFKTTSPQGDGNKQTGYMKHLKTWNFKTTSPQGDGNRKVSVDINGVYMEFQNHIPARGRKLGI